MNKRGFEKQYILLFYMILAVLVGLIILNFVNQVRKDTRFDTQVLAMDSAFLIDSLTASNLDMEIKVSYPKENFNINFKNNPCYIYVLPKEQKISPYIKQCFTNLNFENKQAETPFINIKKQSSNLEIK